MTSFQNDGSLAERSFAISVNDDDPMSSSQDLEHGEMRVLVRYRRKCEGGDLVCFTRRI